MAKDKHKIIQYKWPDAEYSYDDGVGFMCNGPDEPPVWSSVAHPEPPTPTEIGNAGREAGFTLFMDREADERRVEAETALVSQRRDRAEAITKLKDSGAIAGDFS